MSVFMPCQPYFIRHIKNNDELLLYAKEFFYTCESHNIDRDEAILRYKATASTILPKDRPEMFMYRDQVLPDEEFVLRLKSDPDLPKAMVCSKYCKDTIELGAELCKSCPFYTGYCSENVDKEYSLLKFAASSFDNLLYLKNVIEDPKKVFKARIDLFAGLYEVDPLPVPLPLHLYRVLEVAGGDFYSMEELKERLIGLKSLVFSSLIKAGRNNRYDRILKIAPAKQDKIWEIFCLDVVGKSEPSDIASVILELSGEKKPSHESLVDEQLPDIEDIFIVSANPVADSPDTVAVSDIEQSSADAPGEGVAESVSDNDSFDDELPFGRPDVVSESEPALSPDDGSDEDECIEPVSTESEDIVTDTMYDAPPLNNTSFNNSIQKSDASTEDNVRTKIGGNRVSVSLDDPLYIPFISAVQLSDPSGMDDDLALSRSISVEIFRDRGNNLLYVFYIRKNFYVCKPDSPRLKDIMNNRGLIKICWQPFDIYSLCTKNDIPVKSLYSILENELSCFPGELSASYKSVCSKYVHGLSDIALGDGLFVTCMRYYKRIYAIQDMEVCKSSLQMPEIHNYFRLLGCSYHRDRSCKEFSHLFKMHSNGQVEFLDGMSLNVKTEGYELTFVVDNLKGTSPVKLYMDALLRFDTGRFSELQIMTLTGNQMVLFVPSGIYEYVSSYLQYAFDKYAVSTGTPLNVYVASKLHNPVKHLRDRDRSDTEPKNLNEVLDYLASFYLPKESVEVKEISLATIGKPA